MNIQDVHRYAVLFRKFGQILLIRIYDTEIHVFHRLKVIQNSRILYQIKTVLVIGRKSAFQHLHKIKT